MLGDGYTNRHILMLQHIKNSKKNLCISLYIFSSKLGFSKGIWPKNSKEKPLSSLFLQNFFFLCLVFTVWYDTIYCHYSVFISVNVNQNCEFYYEVAASQILSHINHFFFIILLSPPWRYCECLLTHLHTVHWHTLCTMHFGPHWDTLCTPDTGPHCTGGHWTTLGHTLHSGHWPHSGLCRVQSAECRV